jgi:hypothetical protein
MRAKENDLVRSEPTYDSPNHPLNLSFYWLLHVNPIEYLRRASAEDYVLVED